MQKRAFASSKDISLEAKRLAQFLLPIGKPNRNPVHSTKIPASLAGNRKRRGFTSLRAHRMAQFEQIRILERMANGNKGREHPLIPEGQTVCSRADSLGRS